MSFYVKELTFGKHLRMGTDCRGEPTNLVIRGLEFPGSDSLPAWQGDQNPSRKLMETHIESFGNSYNTN